MADGKLSLSTNVGNLGILASEIKRSGADEFGRSVVLTPGKAGTVASEADGAAVITLGTGHGITAGPVGVFWSGGSRLDMTVSAHDGTTITVTMSTGVGAAFPAAATPVIVSVPVVSSAIAFDGTVLKMYVATCKEARAGVNLVDADASSLHVADIAAGESDFWASGLGSASPIDGVVAATHGYNGSTVAGTLKVGGTLG